MLCDTSIQNKKKIRKFCDRGGRGFKIHVFSVTSLMNGPKEIYPIKLQIFLGIV